jgi:hypothetical protein
MLMVVESMGDSVTMPSKTTSLVTILMDKNILVDGETTKRMGLGLHLNQVLSGKGFGIMMCMKEVLKVKNSAA